MDQTSLVDHNRRVTFGRDLVAELLRDGLEVRSAFWHYLPDLGEWRLVIVSPDVDERGGLLVYERIRQTIVRMGADPESFSNVAAWGPNDRLVRPVLRFSPSAGGDTYLGNVPAGDRSLHHVYLYDVRPLASPAVS